jgi:hypothetical protein
MPYKAKVYKVMIASPADVPAERDVVRNVIHEWNSVHSDKEDIVLLPTGWESHSSPSLGDRPQAIINKQVLKDCDLLIAVFWTRLGSPTGKSRSGTVEEIEEHIKTGKPAMIYFSSIAAVPESIDQDQYKALLKFKEELRTRGLIETYSSHAEFREKLSRQLAQTVIRYFLPKKKGNQNEDIDGFSRPKLPSLSEEAKRLIMEVCQDQNAMVLCIRTTEGLIIQTNGKNLAESQDSKNDSKWEAALRKLVQQGYLWDRSGKGELFSLTDEGYRAGDVLREQLVGNPGAYYQTVNGR